MDLEQGWGHSMAYKPKIAFTFYLAAVGCVCRGGGQAVGLNVINERLTNVKIMIFKVWCPYTKYS